MDRVSGVNIEQIAKLSAKKRAKGQVIGLCHGAFDLLHLGHVRHLQQARELCDWLAVTVTSDRFLNKGPGRPVFKAAARVQMLEALDCVDWVGINDSPDAVPAIEAIKPAYYVKGPDYQNSMDWTGGIPREQMAVEAHGGALIFTSGETWSSSHLINENLTVFDSETEEYLTGLRRAGALDQILALIDSVKDYRVVVLGETIIDEYDYVVPIGMPRKEPIIAARYERSERFAGGAAIVANIVAALCKEVEFITCGNGCFPDDQGGVVRALLSNVQIHTVSANRSMIRKKRFIDPLRNRKLFEVYHGDDSTLENFQQDYLLELLKIKGETADLIVVADFGHGMISPATVRVLTGDIRSQTFVAATCQTNSANFGYNLASKYRRVDYLCIDETEARLATQMHNADHVEDVAYALRCAQQTIVTRGTKGCLTLDATPGKMVKIPAVCTNVVDTVGTGDAFLAATAALAKSGANLEHIGFVGNVAGALKAGVVGQRSYLDKVSLVRAITALLK